MKKRGRRFRLDQDNEGEIKGLERGGLEHALVVCSFPERARRSRRGMRYEVVDHGKETRGR